MLREEGTINGVIRFREVDEVRVQWNPPLALRWNSSCSRRTTNMMSMVERPGQNRSVIVSPPVCGVIVVQEAADVFLRA